MVCAMNNWDYQSVCPKHTDLLTTILAILIFIEKLNLGSPSMFIKIINTNILLIFEVARESSTIVI